MRGTNLVQGLMAGTINERNITEGQWADIAITPGLPENFIDRYAERMDWWVLSGC